MFRIMINHACLFKGFSFVFIIQGFFSLVSFIHVELLLRLVLFRRRCILALDGLLLSLIIILFIIPRFIALFLVGLLDVYLFRIRIIMTFFISNIFLCFSLFKNDAFSSILILNLNLLLFLVMVVL